MKTYDELYTVSLCDQGSTYEELLELRGRKCRITIHSDNCQRQGYARAELFCVGTLSWNPAAVIHYGVMETEPKLYVERVSDNGHPRWKEVSNYSADRGNLIDKVLWLLEK